MGCYCPDYPLYNYNAIPLLCCTEKVYHHCLEEQRDKKQISFQQVFHLRNNEEQSVSTIWEATSFLSVEEGFCLSFHNVQNLCRDPQETGTCA